MEDVTREHNRYPSQFPKGAYDDSVSLTPVFLILNKKKFFIFSTTFIACALMLIILILSKILPPQSPFNLLPDVYESRVKVMITWEGMTAVQQNMGLSNPYDAISKTVTMQLQNNPYIELLDQLLHGNMILDKLADKFNLYEEYGLSKQDAREWIKNRLKLSSSTQVPIPTFYIVEISFLYTDKIKTVNFLNESVDLLQDRFITITSSHLNDKKDIIIQRIAAIEMELAGYLQQIKAFKQKHGIMDIKVQGEKQLDLIAENSVKILEKELEIQQLRKYLPPSSPRIKIIQEQIDAITKFINDLKSKSSANFSALKDIPDLAKSYEEIQQNYDIQLAILNKLKLEYEQLKIENINYLKNFAVIEVPEIPEGPAGPGRVGIMLKVLAGAIFLSILWVILKAYLIKLKFNVELVKDRTPEEEPFEQSPPNDRQ